MFGTYKKNDVEILLKDISGMVEFKTTEERERLIQSGTHYSEMLPIEYEPSEEYMQIYMYAMNKYAQKTADAIAILADKILEDKGEKVVLVSLARAGISPGVLIKRYLMYAYGIDVKHYAISIIRGRGIDHNAMKFILSRHSPESIQFVDGWTGKGAIQRELMDAMTSYNDVDPLLAVIADPAKLSGKYGTTEDFLIASSCLNSTISGLLSRTFNRADIISENDFHGAVFYSNLKHIDVTYDFINKVESCFGDINKELYINLNSREGVIEEIKIICDKFNISDINFVKPGIGETTRVLLRRVPWKVLVHSLDDYENLSHIYQLAKEKKVEVEVYPLKNYKACGIIRKLADN